VQEELDKIKSKLGEGASYNSAIMLLMQRKSVIEAFDSVVDSLEAFVKVYCPYNKDEQGRLEPTLETEELLVKCLKVRRDFVELIRGKV